jgi:hypothetical protein
VTELLRIVDVSPVAEWLAVVLVCAFALVQLGQQVIKLLRAWDEYRVNRPGGQPPR